MEPSPSSVSLVNDIRPRKPLGREIKALVTLLSAPYHPSTAENLQTHNATTSISQTSRHDITQGRPTAVDTSTMKENHRRSPPEHNPAVAVSNHTKTKPSVSDENKLIATSKKNEEPLEQAQRPIKLSPDERHIYSSSPFVKDSYFPEASGKDCSRFTSNDWIARMTMCPALFITSALSKERNKRLEKSST
jgi:hypothetical protein